MVQEYSSHPASAHVRDWHTLVIGRTGLDLYPEPDATKTRDATSFSADMGGSAGNIAAAIGQGLQSDAPTTAKVGLISALSEDPVGDFVRNRLRAANVATSLIQTATGNGRTSLAIAEVRPNDCEVVIYRNDAADLQLHPSDALNHAVTHCHNLVITGTALIAEPSRSTCMALLKLAFDTGTCKVWFDLDYRPWNWPDAKSTRDIYLAASVYCHVVVGNDKEFRVLTDDFDQLLTHARKHGQRLLMKRGADGCSLFDQERRLDSGTYSVTALKPYGAGDAFLGNLIHHYQNHHCWQSAIANGSAAAAIVVSKRGCASVMPSTADIEKLQQQSIMIPSPVWS